MTKMRDIKKAAHTAAHQAMAASREVGKAQERRRLIEVLERYFELTQEPDDRGVVTHNPKWDAGFQAAMAILRNEDK